MLSYPRTVDLIVNKTLRSIDAVEFLDSGSVIDAANRAEKLRTISKLRDARRLDWWQ
jgi:hypothetical protein